MEKEVKELEERIISLDRVARVVKGGRRFRFRATVAVGDGMGKVGVGVAKGKDASSAIYKATSQAKKKMIEINLSGSTIPHDIQVSFGSAKVLLKPAKEGTGIIAGGAVRSVVEVAGIRNLLTKTLGSNNKINNTYAVIIGLSKLKPITELSRHDLQKAGKGQK